MSRRYPRRYTNRYAKRRRRSNGDDAISFIAILSTITYAIYHYLSPTSRYLITCAFVAIVVLLFTLVLLIKIRRVNHEQRKLRALTEADIQSMDGLAFEKYVAALLKNEGYTNISLTEKYDMGVDIIATKNNIRWGIQVKRYRQTVKADAVRAVVTALNTYHCDRAMVVTNSFYSRPARLLAESNNCVLVDQDALAKWIIRFQAGNSPDSQKDALKTPLPPTE